MKNDTQFRKQDQGSSQFPMNNKIVKTEKKLQEQHQQEELKAAKAEEPEDSVTISTRITKLTKTVRAQAEALNKNPKVQAAKAEVAAWVKEKAHDVEVAVPKVVARVSKLMAAKPKRKTAAKRKSPAKAKASAVHKARTAKKTAKAPARRKLH